MSTYAMYLRAINNMGKATIPVINKGPTSKLTISQEKKPAGDIKWIKLGLVSC